ncbi:MAG: hypothetical protein KDD62_08710, partial [Bdellovibrionales bacterium]|nr:hypothetical protein [Bdellovibrionales bacterium]
MPYATSHNHLLQGLFLTLGNPGQLPFLLCQTAMMDIHGPRSSEGTKAARDQEDLAQRVTSIRNGLSSIHRNQILNCLVPEESQSLLSLAAEIQKEPSTYARFIANPFQVELAAESGIELRTFIQYAQALTLGDPDFSNQQPEKAIGCQYTPQQLDTVAEHVTLLKLAIADFHRDAPTRSFEATFARLRSQVLGDATPEDPIVRRDLTLYLIRATKMIHESQFAFHPVESDEQLVQFLGNFFGRPLNESTVVERHPLALIVTLDDKDFNELPNGNDANAMVLSSNRLGELSSRLVFMRKSLSSEKRLATEAHELEHVLFQQLFSGVFESQYFGATLRKVENAGNSFEAHQSVAAEIYWQVRDDVRDELAAYSTDLNAIPTLDGLGLDKFKKLLAEVASRIDNSNLTAEDKGLYYSEYSTLFRQAVVAATLDTYVVRRLQAEIQEGKCSLPHEKLTALLQILPLEHGGAARILPSYIQGDSETIIGDFFERGNALAQKFEQAVDTALATQSSLFDHLSVQEIQELGALGGKAFILSAWKAWTHSKHPFTQAMGKMILFNSLSALVDNQESSDAIKSLIYLSRYSTTDTTDHTKGIHMATAAVELEELLATLHCDFAEQAPIAIRLRRLTDSERKDLDAAGLKKLAELMPLQPKATWQRHFPLSALVTCSYRFSCAEFLEPVLTLMKFCEDPRLFQLLCSTVRNNLAMRAAETPARQADSFIRNSETVEFETFKSLARTFALQPRELWGSFNAADFLSFIERSVDKREWLELATPVVQACESAQER